MKILGFLLLLFISVGIVSLSMFKEHTDRTLPGSGTPYEALSVFWKQARSGNEDGLASISAISPIDVISRCSYAEKTSKGEPSLETSSTIESVNDSNDMNFKGGSERFMFESNNVSFETAGFARLIFHNRLDFRNVYVIRQRDFGDEALIEFDYSYGNSTTPQLDRRYVYFYRFDSNWKIVGMMSATGTTGFDSLEFAKTPPVCPRS